MKKSTLRICLVILAACLGISLIYVLCNRSTSRDATAAEINAHRVYRVDCSALPGWEAGMTEKEFLLSLCSFQEEKEIGSNIHQVYSSDVLGEYLHRCHELSEITVMNGTLYITYYAEDQDMVILAYTDDGLNEMAVYDGKTDTLFHEIDGAAVVWNKFRGGFQWGK